MCRGWLSTKPMIPLVFFRPTPRSGTTRPSKLTKGDKTEEARSGRSEPGVALEAQVAVPGLDGVHHLAAILHDHGLIEEHHRVAGRQLVGPAKVFESGSAIVFAAGGRAALEVSGRVVHQQTGGDGSGGQQAVKNVDGRIESLFEQVGAGLKLKPVRIFGRALEVALNAGAGIQQAGRFAACSAAAKMRPRSE